MSPVYKQELIIFIIYALAVGNINGKPKHQLPEKPADAAKVFDSFPSVVAIFDVDRDGDLECLTAVRTDYDKTAQSTKYVWLLKGTQGHGPRNETFLAVPGTKPGDVLFKNIDDDGPLRIGRYEYSDYKNCVVLRAPYKGWEECMLWVSEEAKDNIPQHCSNYFEDNCEDAKLGYDKETCSGVHG
ncbi:hypothetical protein MTO96_026788 [Rhipicephalus appendiculatus]